ncbi:hypothetical protein HPB49_002062 [Dermacentor silvarum]|uniref:Uncharacterized protein n=1 Tax=Dermacentor silvarum TaxID=543639 RepID=A0ACB8D251_DERSI|nr:hypothetical protein HPB49_002062 [Dermacentor silvarum]
MDTDHENEDQMEDASAVEEDFRLPDGVINEGSTTDAGNSAKEGQWKIALSLRTRKQLKSMARYGAHAQENYRGRSDKDFVKPPVQNGTMLGSKPERSRPRRRPPPLPRNDMKIVIRPKPGLAVKDLQTHQVARAISQASGSPQECRGEDFLLRLRPGSNIIVVSTPYERTAELVMKITSLNIQGKQHPVNAYISTPEHLLKGVIHGIDEGTTEDELMANLRVRTQGVKIMHARMFGKTRTAIILFDGPIVPRYVYYYGGQIPCRIYQPTHQFCYTCRNAGHRADVCPEPTFKACKNCNLQNPEEGHKCEPECALCGGVHVTAAPECRNKLKRVPPRGRPPTQPTKKTTKHQSRPKTENIPKKRWLSSDRDGSSSPERSRSCSKSGSRTRSGSRGNKQPETKPQQQKKKKEANGNEAGVANSMGKAVMGETKATVAEAGIAEVAIADAITDVTGEGVAAGWVTKGTGGQGEDNAGTQLQKTNISSCESALNGLWCPDVIYVSVRSLEQCVSGGYPGDGWYSVSGDSWRSVDGVASSWSISVAKAVSSQSRVANAMVKTVVGEAEAGITETIAEAISTRNVSSEGAGGQGKEDVDTELKRKRLL